jgi:hypothetical protein
MIPFWMVFGEKHRNNIADVQSADQLFGHALEVGAWP